MATAIVRPTVETTIYDALLGVDHTWDREEISRLLAAIREAPDRELDRAIQIECENAESAQRLANAINSVDGPEQDPQAPQEDAQGNVEIVAQKGDYTIQVGSWTDPNRIYHVTIVGGEAVSCTCPHFEHRQLPCKHMAVARRQFFS